MIYINVTLPRFINEMLAARPRRFSIRALEALYKELLSTCDDVELDPVAISCAWSEYTSLVDLTADYNHLVDRIMFEEEEEYQLAVLEELEVITTVLSVDTNCLLVYEG